VEHLSSATCEQVSATPASSAAQDTEPVFRVVEAGKIRRGIRLEAIYWQVLREIAAARQKKIGALVGSILAEAPPSVNATAFLRAYCLRWMRDLLAAEREITNPAGVSKLVMASPGPAFALGLDKRLVAYNQPFLDYIQAHFSDAEPEPVRHDLGLALDVQLSPLAATLKANGNRPLEIGFVVSLGGQNLRGRLNAVLAAVSGPGIILCYVLP
jgi:predicted DNA-binding ribbon-helix-helix protein